MGITTHALVAPGDVITSAEQNKTRTNEGVFDARTGGDPGAADKFLVSDGAASAAWVARLTAVLAALGYTPANKAGDSFTGNVGVPGDLSVSGDVGVGDDITAGGDAIITGSIVAGGAYAGGITSAGVPNFLGINVGASGVAAGAGGYSTTGPVNPASYTGGSTSLGSPSFKGINVGADGASIGAGGVATTGPVSPASYTGGSTSTGTPSVKGLVVGSDGIATTGTVAIGGQEVYWSGNPPPSSAGGQLVGEIRLLAATSLTAANAAGWLLCNGQSVSQAVHVALFGALGGTYGSGGGNFNVPDLRGRFPLGVDGSHALGATGGAATINIEHDHSGAPMTISGTAAASGSTLNGRFTAGGANALPDNHTHAVSGSVGGNTADSLSATQSVLNPYLALNYVIYSGVAT